MGINIAVLEALPCHISMRKAALKVNGGKLDSLYDVPRWDCGGESRARGNHSAHKDHLDHDITRSRLVRHQVRALFGKD
jgi:hypothetical protein